MDETKSENKQDVAIIVDLSTGLAVKKTKPRRVPYKYLERTVKDVMNYIIKTIEQEGDNADAALIANIQDQMSGRQHIIKLNGQNVNPSDNFGMVVDKFTQIEDIGDDSENSMKYREVCIVITKVEEGGDDKICKCGDRTPNEEGICDTCYVIDKSDKAEK